MKKRKIYERIFKNKEIRMRDPLIVGIIRETKGHEHRAPLVPSDVEWLIDRGISVEVESSPDRVFSDDEYKKVGARIVERAGAASLLLGIKEPRVHDLLSNRTYMVFSHTAKGQTHNMPLLKACLKKKITLIDYEKIVDLYGTRLVYFGRFAGICGIVDSIHYLGKKLLFKGTENPFARIRPAHEYKSLKDIKLSFEGIAEIIRKKGFLKELSPFIVGITGHGNVSRGVQEILDLFSPVEIHPKDMMEFVQHQRKQRHRFYKIVFLREEKFRAKDGKGFYFEEYLNHPGKFESNLDQYIPYINMLIHTAYWDSRYPRLVPKKMIKRLAKKDPFRLELIGDLSCDIDGSIEITYRTTSREKPTFTYNPLKGKFKDGLKSEGVTVLAVDNLPAELPRDASDDFSGLIRDYVYQIAAHGIKNITMHMAIPAEIRNAVVTQDGKLTKEAAYLKKYIS
jgi:alpha-aminoadipic semialdehyde synthase